MYVVEIITLISFLIFLFACSYTDYKYGKIFNKYLIISILVFFVFFIIEYLLVKITNTVEINLVNKKLINHIIGFVIGFIIGFIFYIVGIFKGGDAKLLAVVGLYVGKDNMPLHFSVIIIVAGIFALLVMLKNKVFIKKIKRVGLYFKGILLTGKIEKYTLDPDDTIKFPFAIYVLLGEIFALFFNYVRG